jgi:hypothetical protein
MKVVTCWLSQTRRDNVEFSKLAQRALTPSQRHRVLGVVDPGSTPKFYPAARGYDDCVEEVLCWIMPHGETH